MEPGCLHIEEASISSSTSPTQVILIRVFGEEPSPKPFPSFSMVNHLLEILFKGRFLGHSIKDSDSKGLK